MVRSGPRGRDGAGARRRRSPAGGRADSGVRVAGLQPSGAWTAEHGRRPDVGRGARVGFAAAQPAAGIRRATHRGRSDATPCAPRDVNTVVEPARGAARYVNRVRAATPVTHSTNALEQCTDRSKAFNDDFGDTHRQAERIRYLLWRYAPTGRKHSMHALDARIDRSKGFDACFGDTHRWAESIRRMLGTHASTGRKRPVNAFMRRATGVEQGAQNGAGAIRPGRPRGPARRRRVIAACGQAGAARERSPSASCAGATPSRRWPRPRAGACRPASRRSRAARCRTPAP